MKKIVKKEEIRELTSTEKTFLIDMLQEKNNLLEEQVKRLNARLKQLEDQKSKNSRNSSKPPSRDQNQPKKTTSSKPKSDKKPGGQLGHKGHYLKKKEDPDEIIRLEVSSCDNCGKDLSKIKSSVETRQEFEIPPPQILVKEYQYLSFGGYLEKRITDPVEACNIACFHKQNENHEEGSGYRNFTNVA